MASAITHDFQIFGDVIAADHIKDDIDITQDVFEFLCFVIQGLIGAEPDAGGAFFFRSCCDDNAGALRFGHLDGGGAYA